MRTGRDRTKVRESYIRGWSHFGEGGGQAYNIQSQLLIFQIPLCKLFSLIPKGGTLVSNCKVYP